MKYGLVYFDGTDNIGDDIQSYAVMQFLPHIDYLIDREQLNEFVGDTKEPTAVVLNGWFLHKKFNWPPSKEIYPLCTSLHFSVNDYMGIGYDFLDGIGGEYLKNYGPVGCRDSSTLDILQKKGIPAFLSGCATLTLPERDRKRQQDYICLVDVPENVSEKVLSDMDGTGIRIEQPTHTVDYIHEPLSWQERMEKVESLLDLYQNAKCVVTKRLHCALPCLALRTPVLLLLDQEKDDVTRYSHFVDLLNVSSTEEFLNGEADFDLLHPPANKENYLSERNRLQESISAFVRHTENHQIRDNFRTWQQTDDNLIYLWRINLLTRAALYASCQVDRLLREKNRIEAETFERVQKIAGEYHRDTNILRQYLDEQRAENERLDSVVAEKDSEEVRLNDVISQKDQEIARINLVIQEKNEEIVRINGVITELNDIIAEYNQAASKQENTISSQKNTITSQKNTISDQSNTITSLNDTILTLNGMITCLNDSVTDLKKQLKAREEEIALWQLFHKEMEGYLRREEESSMTWLLFHSKAFKESGFRHKLGLLKRALFRKRDKEKLYLDDITGRIPWNME